MKFVNYPYLVHCRIFSLNILMLEISKNRPIADAYRRVLESSTFANLPDWKREMITKANANRAEEAKTITPEKFADDMSKSSNGATVELHGDSFDNIFAPLPKGMYGKCSVIIDEGDGPQSATIFIGGFPKRDFGESFIQTLEPHLAKYAGWMKFVRESHGPEEVMMIYSTKSPKILNKLYGLTGKDELRTDFEQGTFLD